MLEPNERGCATIVANDGREIPRNRPFGPVAAGGDGAHSRPYRHAVGAYPRLWSQAPIVPAPAVLRRCGARHLRAPAVKRGKKRSATASAPLAGGHITDMVRFVKPKEPTIPTSNSPVAPGLGCGARCSSDPSSTPQGSGAPCQARGDGRLGVESGHYTKLTALIIRAATVQPARPSPLSEPFRKGL